MRRTAYSLMLVAAVCTGCWRPPNCTIEQSRCGLVWLLPGIEGGPWTLEPAYRALRDAGLRSEIRIFDWQRPGRALANLTEYAENRTKAAGIAREIASYHARQPDAPIDLVGYSGGGGMAILVAEALEDNVQLRQIVLIQPAISPDYDLTPAMRRIDGRLVNFYSARDRFILGWGTKTFGTIDRKFVAAAGQTSFDAERCVCDADLRQRLVQFAWSQNMAAQGHGGDHLGMLSYTWNKQFVAPLLCAVPPIVVAKAD